MRRRYVNIQTAEGLLCRLPMKQGLTSLADVCYLATSMKR